MPLPPSQHLTTMFPTSSDRGANERSRNTSVELNFDRRMSAGSGASFLECRHGEQPYNAVTESQGIQENAFGNEFMFSRMLNKPPSALPSPLGMVLVQLLAEEVKKMSMQLLELHAMNIETRQGLTQHIDKNKAAISELREELSTFSSKQTKTAGAAKNISNQHPKLKPILHSKMLEMCSIERLNVEDHLSMMSKHINRLPDQRELEDVEGHTVWRPVWSEHVDNTINQRFLGAMVDAIMQEETAKCAQSKGELEDDDHVSSTVKTMAKQYWRTLMSEIHAAANPTKQEKADGRLREKHYRTRQSQYVAFLCILDSIHKQWQEGNEGVSSMDRPTSKPIKKHHKTMKKRDNFTPSFDPNLSKLEDRPPHSSKAILTIPFRTMINDAWLTAHPSQQVVDGMDWLKGFYSHAKEGELSDGDTKYLAELAAELAYNNDDI
ncbi:hypothetical protein M404DRAFT_20055 [Pisolithus tinctorius Marx 270]|uniref:Uncharacterized protein n=1 Tax=Pisolithus tinctorius Marx 270 TaxID=870435 RepID=A0A0C3KRP9_PISTI|nr:hypothetical protein M404DRAFT_20055 [Pisolithus tinctorius Marx 270]